MVWTPCWLTFNLIFTCLHKELWLFQLLGIGIQFWSFFQLVLVLDLLQKEAPEVFYKINVLKNPSIFTGKRLVGVSFLTKLQVLSLQLCWKRDTDIDVFLKILQISKNTYFEEPLRATASEIGVICFKFLRFLTPHHFFLTVSIDVSFHYFMFI